MLKITATWKKNMLNMFPFHRESGRVLGSLPSPGAPRVPAGKGRGSAEIQRDGRTPGCTDMPTEPPQRAAAAVERPRAVGQGCSALPRLGQGWVLESLLVSGKFGICFKRGCPNP